MNTTLPSVIKLLNAPCFKGRKAIAHVFGQKLFLFALATVASVACAYGQAPTIDYGAPQTYVGGTAISALTPTSSNVAAAGYNTTTVAIGSGFNSPQGVAVDAAGNVYVADSGDNEVEEIPAGGGATIVHGSGFNGPTDVAVDAEGNVYVADASNDAIKEILVGNSTPVSLGSGFSRPYGVAVDAAGNVYVADCDNNAVKEIPAGNGAVLTLGIGFNSPRGVAVDAAGNVYVADSGHNVVTEIPVSGAAPFNIGSGFVEPFHTAVDAAGNVFVADFGNNAVTEIPAGNGAPVTIATGFSGAPGVVLDGAGNVYATDLGNGLVDEVTPIGGYYLNKFLPAGLSFDDNTGIISGTPTAASNATDYIITAYNNSGSAAATVNITVNLPPLPTLSYGAPQTYVAGTAISALTPTSSNVAAAGYNTTTVALAGAFQEPEGVAVDAAGNIYVSDYYYNGVVEIPAGGGMPVFLGSGFNHPSGLAVDAAGNVYVADLGNNAIKEVLVSNSTTVSLGSGFSAPGGVAVDAAGNVYVADEDNNAVKEILAGNGVVLTLGAGFNHPRGVAVDAAGNVYVADDGNNLVTEIPVSGAAPFNIGSGFFSPSAIVVDAGGNVFVTDQDNHAVKEIPVAGGVPVTIGTGFNSPSGMALDGAGNVYVADFGNTLVEKVTPTGGYHLNKLLPAGLNFDDNTGIISGTPTAASPATDYMITGYNFSGSAAATVNITVSLPPAPTLSYGAPQTYVPSTAISALTPTSSNVAAAGYNTAKVAIGSGFSQPHGVAVDAAGNVYVACKGKVEEIPVGNGASVVLSSAFFAPYDVAVDAAGNVYVADLGNNAITEIPVGNGTPVTLGSGFSRPCSVAVDAAGNVYVADLGNNAVKEIPAGNGAVLTLGAGFNSPLGVAVDAAGNVYVADTGNKVVTEIPVSGAAPFNIGSGFYYPSAIVVDAGGNVFVTDEINNVVKEIPAGNGAPVTIATGFSYPTGVALDGAGNVYVADEGHNQVKEVTPTGGYYLNKFLPAGLSFDDNTGIISGTPTASSPATNYIITAYNYIVSTPTTVNITVGSISYAGTLAALTTMYGTPSASTSFTLSAFTPTAEVLVTPPSGFEVSLDNTTFSSTVTAGSAGSAFSVPVYVRLAAATAVGTYSGNIVLSSAGLSSVNVATAASSVTPAATTVQSITAATSTPTNATTLDYTVTFATLLSNTPSTGDFALSSTGTATGAVNSVTATSATTYDVNVTAVSGDGPLVLSMSSAADVTSGVTNLPFAGGAYTIDNTPPTATISAPSVSSIGNNGNGRVTYTITYADTNFGSSDLTTAGITVNTSGTAAGTVRVKGSGTTYTVSVGNISGLGTLGITLAGGYATDLAGNTDAGAAASATFNVVSSDVTLSGIGLSAGSLSPGFTPGNTGYSVSVPNSVTAITITPTTNFGGATATVNGNAASTQVSLAVGQTQIPVVVTAQDGSTMETYTVTVTRAPNTNLGSMYLSKGTLSPAFATGTTSYTASVPYSVSSLTATATEQNALATITVNGTTVKSGTASGAIPLSVGPNTITIVITGQDGTTKTTYTIVVTRAASTNDNLSALTTSTGSITPAFAQATTAYNLSVANVTASISVTPTTADPTATVSVNGTTVTSGSASGPISLSVGSNTINVAVLAQDGSTIKTYTLIVTRAAASNDNLNNLAISPGTLSPAFAVATTGYTASVANTVTSIAVTPTTGDPNATVTVNGSAAVSGSAFGPVNLNVGSNTINIVVTAANGVTQKTYSIVVTRQQSSNDNLSALTTSTGTITPNFTQATTSYNLTVPNITSSITVTPTTADPTATVKVNSTAVSSGNASGSISLNVGANTISVAVLAQDGSTTKTYTITVTRTAASNDNLGNLHISSGTLSPAFAVATTSYTASVANAIASVTVTPTTGDPNATVTVNGTAVTSGTASTPIALAVGSNTINVLVTAANGVTNKTYSIVVTRATGSADAVDPISVTQPTETPLLADDGINVHKGVSPNGDGIDDFLQIDNITQYPDNRLVIMNRNGQLVYETKGYDNSTKVFDGHSNKTGQMQLPGTYFFALDYTVGGIIKHKTGFLVLKY